MYSIVDEVAEAAREDQLRAVVREHVVGVLAVGLVELGLRLPHGHELDAGAGDGRCPLRELGQRRVGGLVEHDQEARVDRRALPVVAVERLGDEVVEQDGEDDADAALVAERRGQVERVRSGAEPVERDLAAVGAGGEAGSVHGHTALRAVA